MTKVFLILCQIETVSSSSLCEMMTQVLVILVCTRGTLSHCIWVDYNSVWIYFLFKYEVIGWETSLKPIFIYLSHHKLLGR